MKGIKKQDISSNHLLLVSSPTRVRTTWGTLTRRDRRVLDSPGSQTAVAVRAGIRVRPGIKTTAGHSGKSRDGLALPSMLFF